MTTRRAAPGCSSIGSSINRYVRQYISPRYIPYVGLLVVVAYGFIFTQPAVQSTQLSSNGSTNKGPQSKTGEAFQVRTTNAAILQKSSPVDIAFKNVAGDHTKDPHRGAQDEQGQWGYVPDATALRTNPPAFNLTGDALKDACLIRDSDYKMIHDQVSIDPTTKTTQEEREKKGKDYPKILCVIQTTGHRHQEKIPALRQTWGPKCDGFVVASNVTDNSLGTVRIPHGAGESIYERKWLRVRATWSYIYDNYYQDYDWFYVCNDMVFLLMENLRLYLESEEIQSAVQYVHPNVSATHKEAVTQENPIFLGRRSALGGDMEDVFNAGGPGYVLNKASLKLFVLEAGDHPPQQRTSAEDLMIATAFRQFGVYPYDTQDERGGERFMITTPGNHLEDQFPPWYYKQSIGIQRGIDHCSEHSISFHYVPVRLIYRLYALLYGLCPPTR